VVAAVFHTMNHAVFKASLFMAVGIIDHETGTRDMRGCDGLYPFMPGTASLAMVACAAMAGVPLLNGFLSKEMFFAETVLVQFTPSWIDTACRSPPPSPVCSRSSIRCASATTSSSARRRATAPRSPHEPARWMRVPIELLVLACLVVGIVPEPGHRPVLAAAARPSSAAVAGVQPGDLARLQRAA
jgi:multicomponent K+:H+ antiporter subunit A